MRNLICIGARGAGGLDSFGRADWSEAGIRADNVSAVPRCPIFFLRISEKIVLDARVRMKVTKLGFRAIMVSRFRGYKL